MNEHIGEPLEALGLALDTVPPTIAAPPEITTRGRKRYWEGLLWLPEEELLPEGECLGGTYRYVTDLEEAVALLEGWTRDKALSAIDLETSATPIYEDGVLSWQPGSDPFRSLLMLMSICVEDGKAVVLDLRRLISQARFRDALKRYLAACPFITQGGLFEQSFLLAQLGVIPNVVLDTMLMNQISTAGYPKDYKAITTKRNSLEALLHEHCGLIADKSYQSFFLKVHPLSPLNNEAIAYSASDVTKLREIAGNIQKKLEEQEMWHIWTDLEQPLMHWLSLSRVHGVPLDTEKMSVYNEELKLEVETRLGRIKDIAGVDLLPSSPAQLLAWYRDQGQPIADTTAATFEALIKRENPQVDMKDLRDQIGLLAQIPPTPTNGPARLAAAILDYREATKMQGTYTGPLLKKHLNQQTNRIHTWWKQIEADTGRMAAADPNAQNQPPEARAAFCAPVEHTLVGADYSQMELRLLAEMSGEEKMIAVFLRARELEEQIKDYCLNQSITVDPVILKKKDKQSYQRLLQDHPHLGILLEELSGTDFHRATASQIFNVPLSEVTDAQRGQSKTCNFAVPYGVGAFGLAAQSGLSTRASQDLLDLWRRTFPKAAGYLDHEAAKAVRDGVTQTPLGRKRYYPQETRNEIRERLAALYKDWREARQVLPNLEAELATGVGGRAGAQVRALIREAKNKQKAWIKLSTTFRTDTVDELAFKMHRAQQSSIERAGKNQPIQGACADIVKSAWLLAGPALLEVSPTNSVVLVVHDEIVASVSEHRKEISRDVLVAKMMEAGEKVLKVVPCAVSSSISKYWEK